MKLKSKNALSASPEDTRDRLLKAAAGVFLEHGYEGATVREICRKAEANVAMVNYHFGDKLELYRAVIRFAVDAEAKAAVLNQALRENSDPSDALRQIIYGALLRMNTNREQAGLQLRLMLKEVTNPATVLLDEVEGAIRPLYDKIRILVGSILGLPMDHTKTRLCTHSVIGQIAHYVHARPVLSRLWPEMQMTPDQIEMIANHIANFSLAYIRGVKTSPSRKANKKPQRRQK